eukprot:1045123-Amphidinium_carterae.2
MVCALPSRASSTPCPCCHHDALCVCASSYARLEGEEAQRKMAEDAAKAVEAAEVATAEVGSRPDVLRFHCISTNKESFKNGHAPGAGNMNQAQARAIKTNCSCSAVVYSLVSTPLRWSCKPKLPSLLPKWRTCRILTQRGYLKMIFAATWVGLKSGAAG